MPLSPEQRDIVANELKRFAADLNLSDNQREKLDTFLSDAAEKLQEYKRQNPSATKEDLLKRVNENRAAIRERLVNFLTPEQLIKWDSAVAKAKDFLGQKIAA